MVAVSRWETCCSPGLIKRDYSQHVAKLTGAYSLTMGAAAAVGSAMVVPLALHGFGWRGALLMLMLFPLLAFLIWLPQWRNTATANLSNSPRATLARHLAILPRLASHLIPRH
ncbi:Inner membrane transport protein YeaN [Citrobacter koseri]|uniref:Inner membrane transport protein YeaN n=1 Tax=Citrobacter koseri TaxID=545 RepID=A0A2X2WAD7_CITKO|nr:Inner membrane transport protein YeaN [Citrobacter koseri]